MTRSDFIWMKVIAGALVALVTYFGNRDAYLHGIFLLVIVIIIQILVMKEIAHNLHLFSLILLSLHLLIMMKHFGISLLIRHLL